MPSPPPSQALASHTPGPWTIDFESPEVTMVYAVENGQTRPVASVHWSEPNARLIAAAPEMHELLRNRPAVRLSGLDFDVMAHWQETVESLLAKIEGK